MLSLYCRNKKLYFVFIFSAEGLFTSISNKFRMVYKVDGNSQLHSRDWSMYSNILKYSKNCLSARNYYCNWSIIFLTYQHKQAIGSTP